MPNDHLYDCFECRQHLEADGTCPKGYPWVAAATTWYYVWPEISRVRRAYRWVRFILPAYIHAWIAIRWWRLQGSPVPWDIVWDREGDADGYAHFMRMQIINMAWYKAGAFVPSKQIIDDLQDKADQ